MKTLVLATVSAAALMMAGAAAAQALPGNPLVTSDTASKSSLIRQNGTSNSASDDQTYATSGWSLIEQGGVTATTGNNASLTQTGAGSRSVILQDDQQINPSVGSKAANPGRNSATVAQNGANQESGVRQAGGGNFANTTQSGNGDGVSAVAKTGTSITGDPTAPVRAFNSYTSAADGAFVNQVGSGNGSDLSQAGNYDLATVAQTGTTNYGKTTQQQDSSDSSKLTQTEASNVAEVDQYFGGSNASSVAQIGTNYGIVTQDYGNHNASTLTQAGTNIASVTQTGSQNSSNVQQGYGTSPANVAINPPTDFGGRTAASYATVTQDGYSNSSNIAQAKDNSTAAVHQSGMYGTSIINQGGGTSTTFGSMYSDYGSPAAEGHDNYASLNQTGGAYQAFSEIDQRSTANSATVTQAAYGDTSFVVQLTGGNNGASISQGAAGAYSLVYQGGASNYASVKQ